MVDARSSSLGSAADTSLDSSALMADARSGSAGSAAVPSPDAPRRKRPLLTWRRACFFALVLLVLYASAWVYVLLNGSPPLNSAGVPLGGDYIAFHTSGLLLSSGHGADIYQRATVTTVQDQLLHGAVPGFYDAFRNPPFFALLFVPLSNLPYLWAAAIWTLLSLACLATALWLLLKEVPQLRPRWPGLTLLALAFPPVYFSLVDGENALLSLLLYVLIYRALRRDQARAGVWAALGLFKPQLFFLFPLIFVATRRWRMLATYAVTAVVLAGISAALVGPAGLQAWLSTIVDAESGNAAANAWRMASLKSFFDVLLPQSPITALAAYALAAAALTGLVLYQWHRERRATPRLWALTSLVAVLVDPHLVDYDLSVLIPAGAFLAIDDRRLRWPIALLYVLILLRAQLPIGQITLQLVPPLLLVLTLFAAVNARVESTGTRLAHAVERIATAGPRDSRVH